MVKKLIFLYSLFLSVASSLATASPRFPKPDFDQNYNSPTEIFPNSLWEIPELLDLGLLTIFLLLATWFTLKRRSRKGIFWTMIAALLYFGFYREGCICPVGSIQNVTAVTLGNSPTISVVVLGFFLLPIIFSLFAGRIFCGGICPLGAVQELLIFRPLKVPRKLALTLGILPYIYLALSILFTSIDASYIICKFDPFISLFRLSGPGYLIIISICFAVLSLFVARPYCRFLCPYSVLLKLTSFFSWKHFEITKYKCVSCNLCLDSCPIQAIRVPTKENSEIEIATRKKIFLSSLLILPVLTLILGFSLSRLSHIISLNNFQYNLSHRLWLEESGQLKTHSLESEAFLSSGKVAKELHKEAEVIYRRTYRGLWLMGFFISIVIILTIIRNLASSAQRRFTVDRANCLSCTRCLEYCPLTKENQQLFTEKTQ
jgi:NosR/NirI family transcriptional regulator, nitrous oxide reductase regulator